MSQILNEQDSEIDLSSLFAALWRRKGWVLLSTFAGILLALSILVFVDPVYRSNAKVLIERRETVFTRPNDQQNIPAPTNFDTLSIISQVEVMQSRDLLREVARTLELQNEPEFRISSGVSINSFSSLLSLAGLRSGPAPATVDEAVLAKLYEALSVYAINDSRVVAVDVTTKDPRLAAKIANAITDEYLRTQREGTREDTQTASKFLENEIASLRERVAVSERKVEDFRSSADLLAVDEASTLVKQQLGETLTLLSEVNAQRAEAEAKADQIRRLINSGAALDSSSEVQGSQLIQNLREQQVALKARIVDLSTSLLPNHPQIQAARSQAEDLKREISSQALLIARALEGDAEVAKVRQQELQAEVARLKAETSKANEQSIKLRALEREAKAERDLLETYLNRFRESIARQNSELLPVNARVITRASVPIDVHFPKKAPTVGILAFAGFFLSSLFILISELMTGGVVRTVRVDNTYTAENDDFEIKIEEPKARKERQQPKFRSKQTVVEEEPVVEETEEPHSLDHFDIPAKRVDASKNPRLDDVVSELNVEQSAPTFKPKGNKQKQRKAVATPLSSLDDALETIEAYQLAEIAVITPLPNENCSGLAFELARRLAEEEACFFADATAPAMNDPHALPGLSEFVLDDVELDDIVIEDPESELDMLLAGQHVMPEEAWEKGWVIEALEEIAPDYDRRILHISGVEATTHFALLAKRADIVILATDQIIDRETFTSLSTRQLGTLPGHTMFVGFGDGDDIESAA